MTEETSTGTGFIGQIRRLSRRLSGHNLVEKVGPNLVQRDRKPIYSYDSDSQLRIGGILCSELVSTYGTPLYIYDVNRLIDNYNIYLGTLRNLHNNFMLCYAVKANSNLALLDVFSRLGAGFDVVSGGEIERCLAAGISASKIVFSGCGKSLSEIDLAVKTGVYCINVESWSELERIEDMARKYSKVQSIAIRINPDVNLEGSSVHKFGIPLYEALDIFNRAKASAHLKIKGISCHIGSGIHQLEPFLEARDKLLNLADELRTEARIWVEHINLGGGFAAQIATNLDVPDIPVWVEKLAKPITERGLKMVLEPGRSLVADAGLLLTNVEYIKRFGGDPNSPGSSSPRSGSLSGTKTTSTKTSANKAFVIIDAGFNDFARTAMYGQQHKIIPLNANVVTLPGLPAEFKYDVVGPICETTDVFFKDLTLNQNLEPGNTLAICDVGAYGFSMSSNYNSRNRPAEVLIFDSNEGVKHSLIRDREKYSEQFSSEHILANIHFKTASIAEESGDLTKQTISENGDD